MEYIDSLKIHKCCYVDISFLLSQIYLLYISIITNLLHVSKFDNICLCMF